MTDKNSPLMILRRAAIVFVPLLVLHLGAVILCGVATFEAEWPYGDSTGWHEPQWQWSYLGELYRIDEFSVWYYSHFYAMLIIAGLIIAATVVYSVLHWIVTGRWPFSKKREEQADDELHCTDGDCRCGYHEDEEFRDGEWRLKEEQPA